jgi:hypothetical protein
MAPRKKTGRAEAEAAYAALLKENTALVGDVGEAWDALDSVLKQAVELQRQYEDRRAAAVKAGAVTNDQLDQMGYKKTPKIPVLPTRTVEESGASAAPTKSPAAKADTGQQSNGAEGAPQLASVGAPSGEDHH